MYTSSKRPDTRSLIATYRFSSSIINKPVVRDATSRCLREVATPLTLRHMTCLVNKTETNIDCPKLSTVRLSFWNEISNIFSVEYESYMHELPGHLLVSTFFGAPIDFFNCNERCAYMELCAKMWGLNCLEKIIYIH